MPSNEYPGQIYPVTSSGSSTAAPVQPMWFFGSAGGMSVAPPPEVTTVGTYTYPTADVFFHSGGQW